MTTILDSRLGNKKAVNEEMLKNFLEAFNSHDLDAIMSFSTEDCSFDMPKGPHPFGQRYLGKSAVREGLATRFTGIPDVHYGEDRHFVSASGDRGVSEWLLTGTSTSGEKVEVRGCDLFEFNAEKGKIKRKDSLENRAEIDVR
jgi:ketosteroid isomerase-like protein